MTENPYAGKDTFLKSEDVWNEGWNDAIKAVIKQAQVWGMPRHIAKAHFDVLLKKVSE